MNTGQLKNIIETAHINFLVGSGLSTPYLPTVGNTEILLDQLSKTETLETWKIDIIRASILGAFFESVIVKNLDVVDYDKTDSKMMEVLQNYQTFLKTLHTILVKRKSSILSKQVNLFTTNVDLFFERALEDLQIEFNDGFSGRMRPVFSLTNFKKSLLKRSSHYDNTSEMPIFNLLKVHGSLTWKSEGERIIYSGPPEINDIQSAWAAIKDIAIPFGPTNTFAHFQIGVNERSSDPLFKTFLDAYKNLAVVNPTKEKFQETILNLNYYELLRIFSNELEKENALLIVLGFSIADEHIREIIIRAANSNPTLLILIYAYDEVSSSVIEENIKKTNVPLINDNIKIIKPETDELYSFEALNEKVFTALLNKIGTN